MITVTGRLGAPTVLLPYIVILCDHCHWQAGSQIKALSVLDDKVATGSTDKTCRIFDKATTECKLVISLDFGICGVLLVPGTAITIYSNTHYIEVIHYILYSSCTQEASSWAPSD